MSTIIPSSNSGEVPPAMEVSVQVQHGSKSTPNKNMFEGSKVWVVVLFCLVHYHSHNDSFLHATESMALMEDADVVFPAYDVISFRSGSSRGRREQSAVFGTRSFGRRRLPMSIDAQSHVTLSRVRTSSQ